MPLQINLSDYGVDSVNNLAYIAGSMNGEVKPGAGIRDRAMIGDVGLNRTTYSAGTFGANGASGTSGAAKYLSDPNQFSTWLTSEGAAYKNATGMRDAVLSVAKNPSAFDSLSPQMQQNMLASLAAARGVYGTGELRGISGGATMYSVPSVLSSGRTAEHMRYGQDLGVEVGGNVFYGHNRDMSAGVAQGIKSYDVNGAISTAANNLPSTLATPYRSFQPDLFRPQGQGFNPDSVTNPGVPDASNSGITPYDFNGGVNPLGYDTVDNPARPINGVVPEPPGRPSDGEIDLRDAPTRFADSITQGVEGVGNTLGTAIGGLGQSAQDALSGLFGPGPTPLPQPAPGQYDFGQGYDVSGNVGNGSLNPALTPYQPAPGATDFSGQNVSGDVGMRPMHPMLSLPPSQDAPTTPAPAATPMVAAPSATPLVASGTPAEQVASIYQAVLHRAPEAGAADYWSAVLNSGKTDFNGILAQIQGSPEAQTVAAQSGNTIGPQFAAPAAAPQAVQAQSPGAQPQSLGSFYGLNANGSPQEQATSVYQSILGRTPSADESGYWGEMIRTGQTDLNRLAQTFRSSPEGQARLSSMPSQDAQTISPVLSSLVQPQQGQTIGAPNTTPTISNTGTPEQQIASVYQSVLGRQGGPEEVAYWSQVLKNGQNDLSSIAAKFQASPEAQARGPQGLSPLVASQQAPTISAPPATQGLSPLVASNVPPAFAPTIGAGPAAQSINDIYQAELGRPAEQGAIDYGNALVGSGKVTLADFAAQVRNSPEAQARRSMFPSQDAATIGAPSLTPTIDSFGTAPTLGALASAPMVQPDYAQTIGPSFASTIAPTQAPTIGPDYAPTIGPSNAFNASQGLSPYDFSGSNVGGGLGAAPQNFGGFYGPSSGTTNLGMDVTPSNPVGDFSFGGDVSGFDVNAQAQAPAPAPQSEAPITMGGLTWDPQHAENAYLDSQVNFANANNQALDAFNAALTPLGQAPLRAGQFVSGTGDPGIYKAASDYNIATLVANQQALAQKPAAQINTGTIKGSGGNPVQFGAGGPAPFSGRF